MKKLYKQFNDLNLDINIEPMEVSSLEKERVKRNVMMVKKKRHFIKNFIVAATFFIASSMTLGYTFPTFAANLPFIGSIFELFIDDERYVFNNYDQYSTSVGVSQESNEVEVTVTDAVYDGENITIAYTIKSEKDLGERPVLYGDNRELTAKEFGNRYRYGGYSTNYMVQKINSNEYAVLYIFELIRGSKPEEVHINFQGNQIVDLNNVNNSVAGDWAFEFALEKLESETIRVEKDSMKTEGKGIKIEAFKITKTPIATTFYLSEEVLVEKENEAWQGVLIDYIVTDDLGNDYNVIHFRGTSHNTDFKGRENFPRIVANKFDEQATSIMITPVVGVYKIKDSTGALELIKEPYTLKPIAVPIK
ncbi:DUF4179 domain-containing protein [Lysinibacillus capsici]|uniref:DUF4179 domain-containing protein n=1 Tax=Lysinibacillus capsici TaxID=2115968 RepID=UPI002152A66A|nr:DUF4179 domain-containing protein [Lysinibacillus capsici]MCR6524730.1 DUF4179 domain-containing protein [Lysinibacillus capsici]